MTQKWIPISKDEIDSKIKESFVLMTPQQVDLWSKIKVAPVKWKQSPYGDEGGGFWVVAVSNKFVVWYNDIEEGFNYSKYTKKGIIDQYKCNQDQLEWVIQNLILEGETG